MEVKIKKLHPNAVIPQYAKEGDAAQDLTATSYDYVDGRHVYGTGLAFEIPFGYVGLVFPRSSIFKKDQRLTNCCGVLDAGFRGEVRFYFESDAMKPRGEYEQSGLFWDATLLAENNGVRRCPAHLIYQIGDRIGQIIIIPFPQVQFVEAEELSTTARGDSGWGSSGA